MPSQSIWQQATDALSLNSLLIFRLFDTNTGLSSKQKEVYRNVLLRDIDMVNGTGGGGNAGRTVILNIVMQLRKCCNHPYLFAGVEDRKLDPLGEHLIINCGKVLKYKKKRAVKKKGTFFFFLPAFSHFTKDFLSLCFFLFSWKMVLLDKLLKKLYAKGHRVLIFTQMTRMLDIFEDFCVMRRYEYCRIDGNTSYENREDCIDAYNKVSLVPSDTVRAIANFMYLA